MKKNLLSGLIILLPVVVSLVLIIFVLDVLTAPFLAHMENFLQFFAETFSIDLSGHQTMLLIVSQVIILILLFLFVILLGFLGQRLFFNWIVKLTHRIMIKIPLIGSIYRMCKDITTAIFADKKRLISRVVVVPFPCSESNALGLVMGNAPHITQKEGLSEKHQEVLKAVFVPTSPHPLSGFVLLTAEKHLRPVDISLEDTFKFLISCGVYTPPKPSSDENGNEPESHSLPNKE